MIEANILAHILDDDIEMHEVMVSFLESKGINKKQFTITNNADLFLSKIPKSDINIVVIDHRLDEGRTGLDILKKVKEINKYTYVIIITGQKLYKIVINYLRAGADDYVDKNEPDYLDDLVQALLTGFDKAMERINELNEREQIMKQFEEYSRRTKELTDKL